MGCAGHNLAEATPLLADRPWKAWKLLILPTFFMLLFALGLFGQFKCFDLPFQFGFALFVDMFGEVRGERFHIYPVKFR